MDGRWAGTHQSWLLDQQRRVLVSSGDSPFGPQKPPNLEKQTGEGVDTGSQTQFYSSDHIDAGIEAGDERFSSGSVDRVETGKRSGRGVSGLCDRGLPMYLQEDDRYVGFS